ncbi:hypothetical protein D1115_05380 [Vibrio alfacsensis]|uniref:DUF726 domain-containing protein n=1 Tax=Vibrio alfacsensis TaxID=1074311 RepID=A0ABN5PC39_9VIBR|nr:hypothetical protein D1115_05380 [Vibrio alfacsensis]
MQEWYNQERLGKFCSQICIDTELKCHQKLSYHRSNPETLPLLQTGSLLTAETFAHNYKLYQARQGHGWAAEYGNHEIDRLTGKKATLVGIDNATGGADRLVDGVYIQTKYCQNARLSVDAAFGKDGNYKYYIGDHPQQIEVPKEQGPHAVEIMKRRIADGKVPGVTDPNKAYELVTEGKLKYLQAVNVAKFGTVESVIYDVEQNIVTSLYVGGISAAYVFANAVWNGKDHQEALNAASRACLEIGGRHLAISVLSSQTGRTSVTPAVKAMTDNLVRNLSPKTVKALATSLNSISGNLTSNMTNQAARTIVSKALTSNVITGAITVVVLSSGDIVRAFNGRISKTQLLKNVTIATGGVVGGMGGSMGALALFAWIAGTAATGGTAVVVAGVGGLVGGLVGSKGAQTGVSALGVKDDAEVMFEFFQLVLGDLASDFSLTEKEASILMDKLSKADLSSHLNELFSKENRRAHVASLVKPLLIEVVACRQPIVFPEESDVISSSLLMLGATS